MESVDCFWMISVGDVWTIEAWTWTNQTDQILWITDASILHILQILCRVYFDDRVIYQSQISEGMLKHVSVIILIMWPYKTNKVHGVKRQNMKHLMVSLEKHKDRDSCHFFSIPQVFQVLCLVKHVLQACHSNVLQIKHTSFISSLYTMITVIKALHSLLRCV